MVDSAVDGSAVVAGDLGLHVPSVGSPTALVTSG